MGKVIDCCPRCKTTRIKPWTSYQNLRGELIRSYSCVNCGTFTIDAEGRLMP